MNQRGIALPAGLILLAALSLLALTAASGTSLQRNMASNFLEASRARDNAAIATAWARAWLDSRPVSEREGGCETDCILPSGILNPGQVPAQPEFESAAWWRTHAFLSGYNPDSAETLHTPDSGVEPARWLIEEIHYAPTGDVRAENQAEGIGYYRILSRGSGRTSRSIVVTETITARPWEGDFEPGAYPPNGPAGAFCRPFENRYDCGSLAWRQRR